MLAENPLAVSQDDTLLVASFKKQFLAAMNLSEAGDDESTPLTFDTLFPAIRSVPENRILDALATIMASRAVAVLEGIAGERQINKRNDLFKKLEDLG